MAITTRLYCEGRLEAEGFGAGEIQERMRTPGALVWIDLEDPDETAVEGIGREFGFHPLALEDCLHPHQRPKIEQYGSYYFLVAYGASVEGDDLVTHEIAAFAGPNYLVTVRKDPPFDLTETVERWDAHSELAAEGGGFLLYVLLDEIVDGYFDALDRYEDHVEDLEDEVFESAGSDQTQTRIFRLKKELVQFRRAMAPLREVLDVMQRRLVNVVTAPLEPYYRDVYDHVLRATDFLDGLRDILSSALEANLAVVSNRLNEVMKSLTSWAAIILIPTLIAGIYGMNFAHMPELRWRYGYAYALALMAGAGLVLYRVFKRRNWL